MKTTLSLILASFITLTFAEADAEADPGYTSSWIYYTQGAATPTPTPVYATDPSVVTQVITTVCNGCQPSTSNTVYYTPSTTTSYSYPLTTTVQTQYYTPTPTPTQPPALVVYTTLSTTTSCRTYNNGQVSTMYAVVPCTVTTTATVYVPAQTLVQTQPCNSCQTGVVTYTSLVTVASEVPSISPSPTSAVVLVQTVTNAVVSQTAQLIVSGAAKSGQSVAIAMIATFLTAVAFMCL